jgi:hypothetical protein
LQWSVVCPINKLDLLAGVIAICDGIFYDDVKLIRYDLVLLRVLEAGEEGGYVDGRECCG